MYLSERFITANTIFLVVFIVVAALNTRAMLASAAIDLICPTGTTFNDGTGLCVDGSACPQDSTFKNGQCEKSTPPTCPSDTTGPDSNGQCTKTDKTNACPPNTTFENGECKSTTSTPAICPSGYTGPDGQGQCKSTATTPAICPSGYSGPNSQGQCTKTTTISATCASTGGQCSAPPQCPANTRPFFNTEFYPQGVCAAPQQPDANGNPICTVGSFDSRVNLCVAGPITCPGGFTNINGICEAPLTCPSGYSGPNSQGQCTATETTSATCPQGYTLQGVECVSTATTDACQPDSTFQNGECVSITRTPATCPQDTTGPDSAGQCTKTTTTPATCPQGSTLTNGNCVTITQINCPTDTAPDSSGTCVAQPTCATTQGTAAGAVKVAAAGAGGPGVIDPKKYCVTCPKTGKQICDGKQMLKDLEESLKNVAPGQRLSYFEQQIKEILKLTGGNFNAFEATAADGNKIWYGDLGFADVFDLDTGAVYKGKLTNPQQFTPAEGGLFQPNYDKLTVVAPGGPCCLPP